MATGTAFGTARCVGSSRLQQAVCGEPAGRVHVPVVRGAQRVAATRLRVVPHAAALRRGGVACSVSTPLVNSTPVYAGEDPIVAPMVQMGDGEEGGLMQHLFNNRIIFMGGPVNDGMAQMVCSALMALELVDPNEDIKIYLNSPGGQMYSIMAIIDMMNQVKPNVSTVAFGTVQSMSTLILAAGTKGKRYSMKNSRIMINQPIGGLQGSTFDVKLQVAEQNRNLKIAVELLTRYSGKERTYIEECIDRELFLTPEQAIELGFIDGVVSSKI